MAVIDALKQFEARRRRHQDDEFAELCKHIPPDVMRAAMEVIIRSPQADDVVLALIRQTPEYRRWKGL